MNVARRLERRIAGSRQAVGLAWALTAITGLGCGYDWPADNDRGGAGNITLRGDGAPSGDAADAAPRDGASDRPADRPADAGAPDRPADAPATSGTGGSTGTGGQTAPTGTGGANSPTGTGGAMPPVGQPDAGGGAIDVAGPSGMTTVDPAACRKCQETKCQEDFGEEYVARCYDDQMMMGEGPATGVPRNKLCQDILACVRTSACGVVSPGEYATVNVVPCYCGKDVAPAVCSAQDGAANGACKALFEQGAGSAKPSVVVERMKNLTFPVGTAGFVLNCDVSLCKKECTGMGESTNVPAQPTQPTNPVPTQPTNPVPTQPTNPVPTQPTNPVPTQPTNPVPTQPTNPVPTQPTNPVPTQPTNPVPTQPTNPVPTQPTNPVPTQPTNPVPTQPTNPVPTQPTTPVPTQPTTPVPTQPTTPVPTQPTTPVPTQPTTPVPTQPTTPVPSSGACPDLDQSGKPDCQESLLGNGDFDAVTAPWVAEADASLRWEKPDAEGDAQSGALVVTNSSAVMVGRGASQCVPMGAAKTLRVVAQVFIKTGQDPLRAAGLKLQYFEGANCATGALGEHTFLEQGMGGWKLLDGVAITPARTTSVLVRLVAETTAGGAPFEVKFDNVLVRER